METVISVKFESDVQNDATVVFSCGCQMVVEYSVEAEDVKAGSTQISLYEPRWSFCPRHVGGMPEFSMEALLAAVEVQRVLQALEGLTDTR